ncbi:MAG: DUF2911 domain-containing protein [Sphingomonadales bacterium]
MFYSRLMLLLLGALNFQLVFSQQGSSPVSDPNLVADSIRGSVNARTVALFGNDSIRITYHSPAVRKRIIWGGLVPFGEVWVTGAHNATTLEASAPLVIGQTEIAAGKYALFTIPGPDKWVVIINKNWNQHLAWDYDAKEDMVRVEVTPLAAPHLERLQYFITPVSPTNGSIGMRWEKLKIEFPVRLK